jgi:hypothetical protein
VCVRERVKRRREGENTEAADRLPIISIIILMWQENRGDARAPLPAGQPACRPLALCSAHAHTQTPCAKHYARTLRPHPAPAPCARQS